MGRKVIETRYRVGLAHLTRPLTLALVSDLHGARKNGQEALQLLRAAKPDGILAAGDLLESLIQSEPTEPVLRCNAIGLEFLRECAGIAPTFYAFGNHEIGRRMKPGRSGQPPETVDEKRLEENLERIRQTGATLLCNEAITGEGVRIGGFVPRYGQKKDRSDGETVARDPALNWLEGFAAEGGCRILRCHRPEHYVRWVQALSPDLTLSGHAHGGQWRIFGRGIWAPGQGLFPKSTAGVMDGGRLVVSRGLGGLTRVPRIFNRPEVVVLDLTPQQADRETGRSQIN